MPLCHGGVLYGQALCEMGDQRIAYAMLREQIGALLKTASKAIVAWHAGDGPEALRQDIIEVVDAWSATQIDDITLLIARFESESG